MGFEFGNFGVKVVKAAGVTGKSTAPKRVLADDMYQWQWQDARNVLVHWTCILDGKTVEVYLKNKYKTNLRGTAGYEHMILIDGKQVVNVSKTTNPMSVETYMGDNLGSLLMAEGLNEDSLQALCEYKAYVLDKAQSNRPSA